MCDNNVAKWLQSPSASGTRTGKRWAWLRYTCSGSTDDLHLSKPFRYEALSAGTFLQSMTDTGAEMSYMELRYFTTTGNMPQRFIPIADDTFDTL
jgi:hypothetical protein